MSYFFICLIFTINVTDEIYILANHKNIRFWTLTTNFLWEGHHVPNAKNHLQPITWGEVQTWTNIQIQKHIQAYSKKMKIQILMKN